MSKKTKKSGFLNGLTIKPQIIAPSGQVFFTDGTNNGLVGNQTICEQYGFTYNKKILLDFDTSFIKVIKLIYISMLFPLTDTLNYTFKN